MKAIFGMHVITRTRLTIALRERTSTPSTVLKVARRKDSSLRWARPTRGQGPWRADLPPGDYIVRLEGDAAGPVDLRLEGGEAELVTVPVSPANARGPIETVKWTATTATASDPKDPWPPPPPPGGMAVTTETVGQASSEWFKTFLLPQAATISRGGNEAPRLHALVIGVDRYDANPSEVPRYASLAGCVFDALEVEAFLRDRLEVPPEQIVRLIAPLASAEGPAGMPPTYENIVQGFATLTERAKEGDQVYVHCSMHGARVRTAFPELKGEHGLDEALVPCDINFRSTGRYFRDVELAYLVQRMVEKGLKVTLVMDSCHSGGLSRGVAVARRGSDQPDLEVRPSDALGSTVASREALVAAAGRLGLGTARGAEDAAWSLGKIDGASYALVAACRQNEAAYEYAFDGRQRRGALTYAWLEMLGRRRRRLTYGDAQRAVLAGIREHFRDQTPVVIGDLEREVLGVDHVTPGRAIPVLSVNETDVELGAGQAQLMRPGTFLAVAPPETVPELLDLEALPQIEVRSVGATTSQARQVAGAGPVQQGGQAVVLRYHGTLTQAVRLVRSVPEAAPALEALEVAISADTSNLVTLAGYEGAAQLLVDVADEGGGPAYRICDAAGVPVPHLAPAIRTGEPNAAARVVERLVHLARFGAVLTLAAPVTSDLAGAVTAEVLALPRDFTAEVGTAGARPFETTPARLAAGDFFCLRLRNLAPFDVHAVAFDLQPDWGITQLVRDAATLHLAPGETFDLPLRASLPAGCTACTDTIKVIAAREPGQYDWLALEPLGQVRGAHRGVPTGPLSRLMAVLEKPSAAQRHARPVEVPSRSWATTQVLLEIRA